MAANKGGAPRKGAYLFSGLVVCSHCGRSLSGIEKKGKKHYRCHMRNDAGTVVCGWNCVSEEWLIDKVLSVIQEELLAPERLKQLREEIRRQDEEERKPANVDPLKTRLTELARQISQGYKNLAVLPEDVVPRVLQEVKQMEQERDQIGAELKRREGGGNLEGLEEGITACEAILWRLREAVKGGDPLLLRGVLRETIARIELNWERRPYGKRTRYVISGGIIHLRPQTGEKYLALHQKPCNNTTSGPDPAST